MTVEVSPSPNWWFLSWFWFLFLVACCHGSARRFFLGGKNIYDALKGQSDPAAVYASNHSEHCEQVDPVHMTFLRDVEGKSDKTTSTPLKPQ